VRALPVREVIALRDAGSNFMVAGQPTADAAGVGSRSSRVPWVRHKLLTGRVLRLCTRNALLPCWLQAGPVPLLLLEAALPQARSTGPSPLQAAEHRAPWCPTHLTRLRTCAQVQGAPPVERHQLARNPWYDTHPTIWSGTRGRSGAENGLSRTLARASPPSPESAPVSLSEGDRAEPDR